MAALLVASLEGQTYQQRPARRVASRPSSARAVSPPQNKASLASYVSSYTGESQAAPSAQPGQPAISFSAQAEGQLSPSGNYEVIEPGIPVGPGGAPIDGVGAPVAADGCDTCGPAGDCYGGVPCWGPGDCYGGDCYPFLRPLRDRVWFRGEYLLWWLDSYAVPPLVTTSTNPADAGVLGRPTTTTLFGNQNINGDNHSGARFTLGCWLDPCQMAALEVTYTLISEDTTHFQSGIATNSVLARPFYDSGDGVLSSWLVGSPGALQGWVDVLATTQFHSLEAMIRRDLFETGTSHTDFLVGYRYAELHDELTISDHRIRTADGPDPVGTEIDQYDWFDTTNTFHGVQLGFVNKTRYARWSMELLMKLALGSTRSEVAIDGLTITRLNGGTTLTPAGLLTQATNIGETEHDNFTVIPELGVTIGYDLTQRLRGTIGYSFIYWSKVVRPGDQIDFNVNLPEVDGEMPVGALQPAASFKTTDFWAQGLNFGLEYSF